MKKLTHTLHVLWTVLAILAMFAILPASAATTDLKVLPLEAQAHLGATHMLEISYSDFSAFTSTNTAYTITNSIPAKIGVTFVGAVLKTAFASGSTNTESVAMKIGDGSDDDLYLASTEFASDGTAVFVKFGPPDAYTITPTLSKTVVTNDVLNSVVTNVTATAAAGELGRKLYAASGIIVLTITPNAQESLANYTSGKVRFYFRMIDALAD